MGIAHGRLILKNPRKPEMTAVETSALADSGSVYLCIPEHVCLQLELETLESREVTLADGSRKLIRYAGPVHVRFKNRSCFVGALVMGDEVLLGAIPMEDMDLIVIPHTRTVDINPLNPNFAAGLAKSVRRAA